MDIESTDHEQPAESELDPLIQNVVKVPSKQEANVAQAQFLTLCWGMFIMGWTNSSTGPLLPRVQIFYDVSSLNWLVVHYSFDNFSNITIPQIGLGAASWVIILTCSVSDVCTRLLWRLAYMTFRE